MQTSYAQRGLIMHFSEIENWQVLEDEFDGSEEWASEEEELKEDNDNQCFILD